MTVAYKLRSILPVVPGDLKPKVLARVRDLMKAEREKKIHYDSSAKPLLPFPVGDSRRYQEGKKKWKQGIVTKDEGNRSYTVKKSEGAMYQRIDDI